MARNDDFQAQSRTRYDDQRLLLTSHRMDAAGTPIPAPDRTFNHFILTAVQEPDSEIAQVALSSDAPKLYGFGRAHKVFTFQGKILDTNLDKTLESRSGSQFGMTYTGHSYADLQQFYSDFGSLSVCARTRRLVRVVYAGKILYGAINALNITTASAEPNCYEVTMSIFVVREVR